MYASLMILASASYLLLWKKSHHTSFFLFASFFSCIFFLLRLFVHLFSDYLTSAHISSCQFIVESCASPSNNLISLSYLMPDFSANLFWPFFFRNPCNATPWTFFSILAYCATVAINEMRAINLLQWPIYIWQLIAQCSKICKKLQYMGEMIA